MGLEEYKEKRNFDKTPEPKPKQAMHRGALKFVVQRHEASKLHYDFRLEMEGVLKSWAVPKGPSMNPSDKRLAVQVEDHPYEYRTFEGDIPGGSYGAGHVDIWDEGEYYVKDEKSKADGEKMLLAGLEKGSLSFVLEGKKLRGEFSLVRLKRGNGETWLLIKKKDEEAVSEPYDSEDYVPDRREPKLTAMQKGGRSGNIGGSTSASAKPETAPKEQKKKRAKKETQEASAETKPTLMPHHIKPMLAKLADAPFDSPDWIFEIKWDGYRAVAEIENGEVNLYSRNEKSFNEKYPLIAEELKRFGHDAILDGEIVVTDEKGNSSFQLLQNYQNTKTEHLYYYVFDLLYLNGYDMHNLPLAERKKFLKQVIGELPHIRYSDHVEGSGEAFFKEAQANRIEGIVAKDARSPYRTGGRSSEWLKIKTHSRQEVVIAGFTAPKGTRKYFGALILGVYEEGELKYVGHSGSGFDTKMLKVLYEKMTPLVQEDSPFDEKVATNSPVTWIRPELVAEISFSEWTKDGQMRHPIFEGLREDKQATEVVHEQEVHSSEAVKEQHEPPKRTYKVAAKPKKGEQEVEIDGHTLKLTNLHKVYWEEEEYTKADLIEYYHEVSDFILPYLKDRAESMLRHPNGIGEKGFFQKDIGEHHPDWVETVEIFSESTQQNVNYLVCQNLATLTFMNNLGCIEINPWHSRINSLENPDYMVIDLDPGQNTYDEVVETALVVKEVLDRAGAECYCKTSGATGMHIYVPLGGLYTFDQSENFAKIVGYIVNDALPDLTSLQRSPKARRNKIYIDCLQNHIAQTIVAPYSVRPKPGATVSTPLQWNEVKPGLHPSAFTIKTVPARLKKVGDLFAAILGKGVDLKKCLDRLGA